MLPKGGCPLSGCLGGHAWVLRPHLFPLLPPPLAPPHLTLFSPGMHISTVQQLSELTRRYGWLYPCGPLLPVTPTWTLTEIILRL